MLKTVDNIYVFHRIVRVLSENRMKERLYFNSLWAPCPGYLLLILYDRLSSRKAVLADVLIWENISEA